MSTTRRAAHAPPLWLIYALLLIPFGLLTVFNYVPAISGLYHAFTDWDVGARRVHWLGLRNFATILADPVFHTSCWNLLRLGGFVLLVQLLVPFAVAEMIFHLKCERWRFFCRAALVMPLVVPGVVIIMIWQQLYSDAGLFTELCYWIGKPEWVRGWLTEPQSALWAVAFVGFPFASGFNVLIYYAGLAGISSDVLEAAELDGLGPLGRIARIHIPLVLQQFKLLLIITVIGVVNGFEGVLLLTGDGGPGYVTLLPGLYMYQQGFLYQRMGLACALGLMMLLFLLAFTLVLNRVMRTEKYDPTARA